MTKTKRSAPVIGSTPLLLQNFINFCLISTQKNLSFCLLFCIHILCWFFHPNFLFLIRIIQNKNIHFVILFLHGNLTFLRHFYHITICLHNTCIIQKSFFTSVLRMISTFFFFRKAFTFSLVKVPPK